MFGRWTGRHRPIEHPYIDIRFVPAGDITSYELARIIINVQGVNSLFHIPIRPADWEALEPAIKRHFTIVSKEKT